MSNSEIILFESILIYIQPVQSSLTSVFNWLVSLQHLCSNFYMKSVRAVADDTEFFFSVPQGTYRQETITLPQLVIWVRKYVANWL